jgi:hypothetical protein
MKKVVNKIPLISEDYPEDYTSYRFISLVQFNKENLLTVIENIDEQYLHCYVIDLCGPEEIDEKTFLEIANDWHENQDIKYPLSVHFTKMGVSAIFSRLLRKYPVEFVSRVIGPIPKFAMTGVSAVKRKKKRVVNLDEAQHPISQFIDC